MCAHRAELDRINVFPVPDGDTGTNLALTMRAMAEAIKGVRELSVSGVASRLAEAGVLGARGNSGMMMSHFFLGFAEGLEGRARAGSTELAAAMRRACDSLYQAVEQPIEGTILTVVRESTEELVHLSRRIRDLEPLARRLLAAARASLERTPRLLPVLREAHVVDAGAKGFVRFLEGMVGLIDGHMPRHSLSLALRTPDAAASVDFPEDDRAYRYCSEFLVRGAPLPERRALADAVKGMGGSLIVTRATAVAKVHIHTDEPARVEEALTRVGGTVERVKSEDMRAQHQTRRQQQRRPLALVTDTTCDLPPELILEHDITVVPLTVAFGDEIFLDQVDITNEDLVGRLLDPASPQPTTSQPTPAHLEGSFKRAAEHGEEVLALLVSGGVSGTLGQAQAVASRFSDARVRVYDSRTASLGLGFQVLRAAELLSQGWDGERITAELERLRGRSGVFLTVDTLTYLQRSGRVGRARAFLGNLFGLKPILAVDDSGTLVPVDRVRGRDAVMPRVLELLREQVPPERSHLRMGVAHVLAEGVADELAEALRREFSPDEIMVRSAAGVISVHTGPGAWAVFYQAL